MLLADMLRISPKLEQTPKIWFSTKYRKRCIAFLRGLGAKIQNINGKVKPLNKKAYNLTCNIYFIILFQVASKLRCESNAKFAKAVF